MPDLSQLQQSLAITFTNQDLLTTAFTHRSFINESNGQVIEHNERLEFLGDAVLEIIVSEYLFRIFPTLREGNLTAIRSAAVRMETLAKIASELHFGGYIRMAKGEEATGGRSRPYILANTFEAFLGALFLDQGIEVCKQFLSSVFFAKIDTIVQAKEYIDSKSRLQEVTQERFKQTPSYKLIKTQGPDHDRTFTVQVIVHDSILGIGIGKSKQQAQQEAAKDALKKL